MFEDGPGLRDGYESVLRTDRRKAFGSYSEPCTETTNKGTQSETGRQTVQRLERKKERNIGKKNY